jgi:SAM-dependent methyltransferase
VRTWSAREQHHRRWSVSSAKVLLRASKRARTLGPMTSDLSTYYDASFYEEYQGGSRASAAAVVPIVNQLVQPTSVLDVGCGIGAWLVQWTSEGVTDILGVDGEHVDPTALQIARTSFQEVDLRNPLSLNRKFDLVQSLEVAEHLDDVLADQFVRSLTSHGDTILFSAAIPGQRGFHHVNEQWPSYWVSRFAREGFKVFDIIRPVIWSDSRVDIWYRQNTLLFSRTLTLSDNSACLDIVHPGLWQGRQDPSGFTLRELARAMPSAAKAAAKSYGVRARAKLRSPSTNR